MTKMQSNDQIREELTKLRYSAKLIDDIIEQFWFHDWGNSFILINDNFQILVKFLKEKNPDTFSRFDFYYYYFFEKIIPNDKKLRASFQQLGLYFEQLQKNQIPLTEFIKALKKLRVPTSLTVEYLKNLKLIFISKHDGTKIVNWSHHTLTEFLAADYIVGQKNSVVEIEKLIIDSKTGNYLLKPSWMGTLRFIIEQNSDDFTSWIVKFLLTNPESLIDQVAEVIVFATSPGVKPKLQEDLFLLVFGHYQEKKFWIPVWTYHNFYKFINKRIYTDLKANVNDKEFVHRGNIAAIIDGMLLHNHPLLTQKEKPFWKKQLISYAKESNGNGVLNRHVLAALENFKGHTDIIPQVKKNRTSKDSLVREAYISMCRAVDANSSDSIETFVSAIADNTSHVYARSALYFIDSTKGIETFLRRIAENPEFIHKFLNKESIFNKQDTQADSKLIRNIQKNKSPAIITLLKKLIVSAYTGERNYDAGKSYFLKQIALIIQSEDQKYLDELVQTILDLDPEKKKILFINDVEGILSVLLNPETLEKFREIFNDELHHHAGYALAEAVRLAPHTENPKGNEVLKKGIELGITVDPKTYPKYRDYQKEQDEKIYKQFQQYLSPPEKDKYFPQVFRYFLENEKLLQAKASPEEKERLLKLAIESNLDKIDPTKIKVRYKNSKTKLGEYTISSFASYFGDVLGVIHELKPAVLHKLKNRKKVINFIPFTYLSDFKRLQQILGKITDKELEPVNKVMLDKTKDVRYLVPQTYTYIAKTYPTLKSSKEVLLSFVSDTILPDHEREYALENLDRYLTSADVKAKTFLKKLWNPKARSQISDLANGLLITIFRDEEAIDWRFNTLKISATSFHRQEGFHSVGSLEMELNTKAFARSLINLNDEKYLDRFIDLLDFSLTIVKKPDHREYANYLRNIVISFVARDEFLLSAEALATLRSWAEEHLGTPETNWFLKQVSELISKNNLVIKVIRSKDILAHLKHKKIKWTQQLLRAEMKEWGTEQKIDLFISHASEGEGASIGENSFVKKLDEELKKTGLEPFLDVNNEAPTISQKVEYALLRSKFLLIVGSERYCKRLNVDKTVVLAMEKNHFIDIQDVTSLPLIFLATYKMGKNDWKLHAPPSLKGGIWQIDVAYDSDGEINKVIKEFTSWLKKVDPKTANKIKNN